MDPYAVLQVAPEAEHAVIAAAYRALARRYHPDLAGDDRTSTMRIINAAWEILREPTSRRAYDGGRGQSVSTSTVADNIVGRAQATQHAPAGTGAAGPPPGRPSGSVLAFGRHIGWSLGEIARLDPGYLDWLEARRDGGPYREEIDLLLRRTGWRRDAVPTGAKRRGWFGR